MTFKCGILRKISSEEDAGPGKSVNETVKDRNDALLTANIEALDALITDLTTADGSDLQTDYLRYQSKRKSIARLLINDTLADTGAPADRTADLALLNADKTTMQNAETAIAGLVDYSLASIVASYNVQIGIINALFK